MAMVDVFGTFCTKIATTYGPRFGAVGGTQPPRRRGGGGAQSPPAVADVEGDAAAIDAIVGAIVDAILDAIVAQ